MGNLISVITASGSIVAPLDNYLGTICSSSACSNGTLTEANNTITDNCGTDIQDRNTLVTALQTIIDEYPVVREVACLQATGNNTRCLTQTPYAVQNATGEQLSTSFLTGMLSGSGLSNLTNIDASVLCTDCTKAMYQTAQNAQGNNGTFAASALGKAIDSKCGSGFATGTFPSGVTDPFSSSTAATTGASQTGGASASTSRGASVKDWTVTGNSVWIASLVGFVGVAGGAIGIFA